MKVLVFGGTGRLSKDVVKVLVDNGVQIFCLTRGSGQREMFINKKAVMLYADIRDLEQCKKILGGEYYDVVIDFISYTPQNIENKMEILGFNFSQYIYVSSATVYQPTDVAHCEKTSEINNMKWDYSANKVRSEMYLGTLKDKFKNNNAYYTIVRPYVTYGNTRMPYPLVPLDITCEYSFVRKIIKGEEIAVVNLDNKVTITHAYDFAQGVLGLLKNKYSVFEDFHITCDDTYMWEDVIDICGKVLKTNVKKVRYDLQEILFCLPEYKELMLCDKANNWIFDNSKIKQAVPGFKCKVDIEKGLSEMIEFYKIKGATQQRDFHYEKKIQQLCKCR